MADSYLKPQSPIRDGEDYILPITSYDQIVMPDGISRWDGVSGSTVKNISDINGLEEAIASAGKVKTINSIEADENGNIEITASDLDAIYVERTDEDITANPPLIDADTLGGISHDQYALKQDIPNLNDVQVTWDEVQNVPSEFSPTAHGHDIGDISGISYEEWVFTYEDGSTETKKVILGV